MAKTAGKTYARPCEVKFLLRKDGGLRRQPPPRKVAFGNFFAAAALRGSLAGLGRRPIACSPIKKNFFFYTRGAA